ncbi:MAG: N-acetylglucosamine-6-phosphate deacetylase [Gemmataceae bacterium]
MLLRARHYATGEIVDVCCEAGSIRSLQSPSERAPDLEGGWIAPALFDLQINGCDGYSFNSEQLTIEHARHIITTCHKHGISQLCPTLITNSHHALRHGMTTLRRACEVDAAIARAVPALHLEGPYISAEDGPRGAHPRQHVRPPNWDEFQRLQEAAGGRIRLVTLAPEHEGALPFIERLVAAGVVVALGHTAASGARIRDAIAAGARLSTHLGNGSHALLPRHDNYIWEQLAADELWASIIGDGHHLPSTVVKCFIRVKTPARSILTCDASSLAGMPPGSYAVWDQQIDVLPEGKVVVAGTSYLAGSWAFTDLCIGNVLRWTGVTLAEALDMAGARPRELLGLAPRLLEVDAPADVILFDWEPGHDLRIQNVILAGKVVSSGMTAGV